ncbi:hypothetical protein CEP49_03770 [Mergibacter septicus]|uniref:phosphatase PAP2 family protein n=1 Tax=Mergibacter septicus TaxID=221402 RepID=UPI0011792658|nr:phosphatase PAP2 family protein [Mergibacter septicus]AWX13730.1 hypothetical protein CEP49_03770 [Mergibacter septicus]
MKNIFSRNFNVIKDFLVLYLPFNFILILLLNLYSKSEVHLLLTSIHNHLLDFIFKHITLLGNAAFIITIGILFSIYRLRAGCYIFLTQLVNVTITRLFKLYFSADRPIVYFTKYYPDIQLHQVENVVLSTHNSFPSGHTSAIFALMLSITIIVKKKSITLICAILAILTGYSRVYLSQHFASDILFGSFIGIFSALLLSPFLYHSKSIKNNKKIP